MSFGLRLSTKFNMEKITKENIKSHISMIGNEFSPSQKTLCLPIINRICQKMSNGLKFDDIKVCGAVILDGHHRYISARITKFAIGNVPSQRTSATCEYNWDEIDFDNNDWDTNAKILLLNELDAYYNDLDIEVLTRLTASVE